MTNTYLMTGGAGFIGSHVTDRLLERGDTVLCLDNFNDYYDPTVKRANTARHLLNGNFHLFEGDIRDRHVVPQLMRQYQPDVVVHLAACAGVRPSLLDPFKYQSVNLEGTLNMLEAAKNTNVRMFVNASSSSVYGENTRAPFEETDALLTPASPYGATKLGAEGMVRVYARQYSMRAVSLRFFTVYGPRQRPDMAITKFATRILGGEPITVYGDGGARRDFTYVDDIVDGVLSACDYTGSDYEAFNLGSGRTVTLEQLISGLEQALGLVARRHYAEEQPGDVPLTCSNISKAARLLGYAPRTQLEEGLPQVVRFVRGNLSTPAKLVLPASLSTLNALRSTGMGRSPSRAATQTAPGTKGAVRWEQSTTV